LLAIGSLMLFGTFYDIYVHRPLEKSIRIQRAMENSNDVGGKIFAFHQPRSRLILFLRMFSMVKYINLISMINYKICRPEIWITF
jgi:hypothetical protein